MFKINFIWFLYGAASLFFTIWCSLWLIHLTAILYGKYKLYRPLQPSVDDTFFHGVSILKPVIGVDANLFSNLETFFTMKYPKYEVLFAVEDPNDAAIPLINILMENFPNVETKVFIGGSNVGVNPKINNMYNAYEAAQYEFILISDSCIRMEEDTLQVMMSEMEEKVGLVNQMPFVYDKEGFAANLQKIYFGTSHSRMYLFGYLVRLNPHNGMSSLLRKTILDETGGIKQFGEYLAEDFFIAKCINEKGWIVKLSTRPALQNCALSEVRGFIDRHTRWIQLRIAMLPFLIIAEPFSHCLIVGATAAWAAKIILNWDPIAFYLIHILVWFILDWIIFTIVQNGPLSLSKIDFVIGWLTHELLSPYLYVSAILDSNVKWQYRVFKLKWGGEAHEIKLKAKI